MNGVKTALVLSGGGARGAYQAGVVRGLMDIGVLPDGFQILVGSSAGSINAGVLAAHAQNFGAGVATLQSVWSQIEPEQVFRTDARSLGSIGVRWAWDLTLGGALGHVAPKSLLDTAPLRQLLERTIPFRQIDANVHNGTLHALAVAATDLHTAEGVIFIHARPDTPLWERRRWRVQRTKVRVEHLLASSAIPVFFPSVPIGGRYYADGCIRNTAPLRPAINLGADRIVAIGVSGPHPPPVLRSPPSIAQIAGVLLDAVMLDALETDVAHGERINTSVVACKSFGCGNPLRAVDLLWLSPSVDIGAIAAEMEGRIPSVVRYLMRGLGTDEATTDLASYLLFDTAFCTRLIELGRSDVAAARTDIQAFFCRTDRPGMTPVNSHTTLPGQGTLGHRQQEDRPTLGVVDRRNYEAD